MNQKGDIPYDPENENLVYQALKDSNKALNVKEISQKTDLHRNTIPKYVKVLLHTNRIEVDRKIGKSKLYTDK